MKKIWEFLLEHHDLYIRFECQCTRENKIELRFIRLNTETMERKNLTIEITKELIEDTEDHFIIEEFLNKVKNQLL